MPKHDDTTGAGDNRCMTTPTRMGRALFCWNGPTALGVMSWANAFKTGVFGKGQFEVPGRR